MTTLAAAVPRPGARRTIAGTLVVLAVGCGFWLLYRLAGVAFDVFFALVIGTALRPVAEALVRRGLSRRGAGLVLSAGILALLAVAVILLLPALAEKIDEVGRQLPGHVERARAWLATSSSATVRQLARELPSIHAGQAPVPVAGGQAASYLGSAASVLVNLIGVTLLAFYWLVDGERMTRTLLLAIEEPRREVVRAFVADSEAKVGGYVRGQLLVCSASAVMCSLAYLALGVPNAVAFGVFFGALAILPVLGAPLGAAPAFLTALSTEPRLVPWVVVTAAVVHLIQDYVLAPRLIGGKVGVNAFLVILAVVAFGSLLGLAGAVLAIPITAMIQLVVDRFVLEEPEPPVVVETRDQKAVLRLRATELAHDARARTRDRVVDLIESLAKDVEKRLR
jgi:predicted PurR-regulated permease PerM